MKIAFAVAALVASPVLADDCVYDSGRGSSIRVLDDAEAFEVDFGDWTETCTADVGKPHADNTMAWPVAAVAKCDNFTAQWAFVPIDGKFPAEALVFDGNVFHRRCS